MKPRRLTSAFCLLTSAFLTTMCATTNQQTHRLPTVEQMSLDEKIGQLFVYDGHGLFMSDSSEKFRQFVHHIRDNHVGGIIWFVSDVYETAFLTERLQREAKVPLLVSADLEAGIGMRFENTTFWPSAMAIAATGEPKFAEELGRISAQEAKTIGINHILAPVCDVNVDPDNPVINTRSFGEDPQDVARYVTAFIRGVQSENVLATAKHFPGHGDTHVDSHRSLPVLDVTRERLEKVELVPFRAAIDAGVASVMIGHLAVPSLDAAPAPVRAFGDQNEDNPYGTLEGETEAAGTVPAGLSEPIVTDLLRKELHFQGLIVSDAFDMGGLVAHYAAGEAAVKAIEAGQDQVIKSANLDAAVTATREAVRSGRISESRIDESVRRVLAAKARVGVPGGSQEAIFRTIDSEEHRKTAAEIAQRAVTLLRAEDAALPVKKNARAVVVTINQFVEPISPMAEIESEIAKRMSTKPALFLLDPQSRDEDAQRVVDAARRADVVILAVAVRARSGAGHLAIPAAAQRAIEALAALPAKVITVAFGTPYLIRDIPQTRTYLCAYGIQPVMQTAVAKALFGEAPISGSLPVTIPGMFKRGEGIHRERR